MLPTKIILFGKFSIKKQTNKNMLQKDEMNSNCKYVKRMRKKHMIVIPVNVELTRHCLSTYEDAGRPLLPRVKVVTEHAQ